MIKELPLSKKQIKRLIISQQDIIAAGDFVYQLLKHSYHDPDYLENIEEFSNSDEYRNIGRFDNRIYCVIFTPFHRKQRGKNSYILII